MADIGAVREAELRKKEICRFCLAQQSKLASIFIENTRIKSTASLPLQIMAITSIEVSRVFWFYVRLSPHFDDNE